MMPRVLRVIGGLPLMGAVAYAVFSGAPPVAGATALAVAALTFWRADAGLMAAAMLTPAGLLLGAAPAQAATMVAWAFLGAWLLAVQRPLGRPEWPRGLAVAVVVFAACITGSWITVMLRDMEGVAGSAIPLIATQTILIDHLAFTASDSATGTFLLHFTGLLLMVAASALGRSMPELPRRIAIVIAASMAALALATMVKIAVDWVHFDYGGWFLRRFLGTERYALHLPDLNAAGSQYVLGLLVALTLAVTGRGRWWWAIACAVMLPAAWVSGSRSAAVAAGVVGLTVAGVARGRWRPTRTQLAAVCVAALVAAAAAGVAMSKDIDERGAAGRAMWLRGQFMATSARMFAAAPAFGFGIGQYHSYSPPFMPAQLRAIYPSENAHNFFAQQLVELGLVGGLAFAAIAGLLIRALLRRGTELPPHGLALAAATLGYLVTCITGHPLLVPEAAFPFWIAAGTALATTPVPLARIRPSAALLAVSLAVVVAAAPDARAAARPSPQPLGNGLSLPEHAADGTQFKWSDRHVVEYIGAAPGFLTIRARAPEVPTGKPFEMAVSVDGRTVARHEISNSEWTQIQVPLRPRGGAKYLRIDLRLNQTWLTPPIDSRGRRLQRGVMVSELRIER